MTGGRMAEREGTAAAAPERPRRGEACCLSPQGELHASSVGADMLRSSAQLATARHRTAPALKRVRRWGFEAWAIKEAGL